MNALVAALPAGGSAARAGWVGDVAGWLGDPVHWRGEAGVPHRLLEHLVLSIAAVAIAAVVAVPVGLWLGHIRRGGALAVNVGNVGRAVPTFAVLVLLALAPGPFGLSTTSIVTALVLFAVPPMLTNTHAGVTSVDRDVVDAARGMGMSGWQVLRHVELPLSLPLLLTGVRLAAVQVVATATIAALVAGGGLGRLIAHGYAVQDQAELVAGALLVAVLALSIEGLLALLERRAVVTPRS